MNFLGHFLLTRELLKKLSRVVHVTSGAHRGAPKDGVPLTLEGLNDASMGAYARYGVSKLASLLLAQELDRRSGRAVYSNAVHPGVVASAPQPGSKQCILDDIKY